MKKIIFVSLLTIPLCKAADTNYYQQAYDAIQDGDWQRIYELIDKGNFGVNELIDNDSLVFIAVDQKNLDALQELVNRNADPNIGWRLPLMFASNHYLAGLKKDNMSLIELLLKSGADPYLKDVFGVSTFDSVMISDLEKKKKLIDLFNQYGHRHIKPAKKP